jgi:hypothetical protein
VALGQVLSEYFDFFCQFSFHRLLHIHHPSSGAGTMGQIVADVPSGLSLTPPQENNPHYISIMCSFYVLHVKKAHGFLCFVNSQFFLTETLSFVPFKHCFVVKTLSDRNHGAFLSTLTNLNVWHVRLTDNPRFAVFSLCFASCISTEEMISYSSSSRIPVISIVTSY